MSITVTSMPVNSDQSELNLERTFPTSAAVRYDRALRKSKALHPPPKGTQEPVFTAEWPPENVELLERYRDWLVAGGVATSVICYHRIPMAGHVLGLSLKPYRQLNLKQDFENAFLYVKAKKKSEMWERNCHHSLEWFRKFMRLELGLVIRTEKQVHGNAERYKAGLPAWLIDHLTRYLHIRQGNWRISRRAESTYQFWSKYTHVWRWLFEKSEVKTANEIERRHIFTYIDEMLVIGYAPKSINHNLYSFQATLRFLDQYDIAFNPSLLSITGLKVDDSLPRALSDRQVRALRKEYERQVAAAKTHVQKRNSQLNRAAFYLLWQTGMRVSELEDLLLEDVDFEARRITIRQAKGLKDRTIYLTESVIDELRTYLKVRGPALTEHLFIYRHKPVSKELIRLRIKAAGKRAGVKVTPHVLRHTFGTQLVNAGAKITTIQMLLGHKRLGTTMIYARVHDETVAKDYFEAMQEIEQAAVDLGFPLEEDNPEPKTLLNLLNGLENGHLDAQQRQILDELRRCLSN